MGTRFSGGPDQLNALLEFYSTDAKYSGPMTPNGVKGHERLKKFYYSSLSTFPNWKFELIDVLPTEMGLIKNYKATIPYGSKTLDNFTGLDIIELNRNGFISRHCGFFDTSCLEHELGITAL